MFCQYLVSSSSEASFFSRDRGSLSSRVYISRRSMRLSSSSTTPRLRMKWATM